MSQKIKCQKNLCKNIIKNHNKCKCHKNWRVTKTEVDQKQKGQKNWNVTNTEMSQQITSQKLKCHNNWNVTKADMSQKLKCQKNEMSQKIPTQQFFYQPNQMGGGYIFINFFCLLLVLLSALVERVSVSRMWDFFLLLQPVWQKTTTKNKQ